MKGTRYAIFLRGVNVGGNAKIGMSELKNVLTENGYTSVLSYINSGNLVLDADADGKLLAKNLRLLIKSRFGLEIEFIVKTSPELQKIISSHPYDPEHEITDSKKIVMLLSGTIDPGKMQVLKKDFPLEENYYLFNDAIYIYYHNGSGRSRFSVNLIERKFNVIATARNWNTLVKMKELVSSV